MTFQIGSVVVPAPMAALASRRALAKFREGTLFDYPLSNTLAAVYMQGFIDAVDVMQNRQDPTDAD